LLLLCFVAWSCCKHIKAPCQPSIWHKPFVSHQVSAATCNLDWPYPQPSMRVPRSLIYAPIESCGGHLHSMLTHHGSRWQFGKLLGPGPETHFHWLQNPSARKKFWPNREEHKLPVFNYITPLVPINKLPWWCLWPLVANMFHPTLAIVSEMGFLSFSRTSTPGFLT
jgi:hypothetical protein